MTAAFQFLNRYDIENELARRSLLDFTLATKENYIVNWHHKLICKYLERFISGEINRLMINIGPQTGKSELSSRRLPAYLFGKNPDLKISMAIYNHDKALEFRNDLTLIMESSRYKEIFPKSKVYGTKVLRIGDGEGKYLPVGICGALTSEKVDILIVDDVVKDDIQAKSPTYQIRNWNWWNSVASTRLHNNSKVLFLMTRWDKGDLAGRILSNVKNGIGEPWVVLVLPSIKETNDNPEDPREIGEALWPEMHSLERLLAAKALDPGTFQALHQQNPSVATEYKIFNGWLKIDKMPEGIDKFYGLDWGFTNAPTGVLECMHHNDRGYVRELMYETEMTNQDIVNGKQKRDYYVPGLKSLGVGSYPVYCDSAEPKSIQELRDLNINAKPSIHGPGSINAQITFLKSKQMHYVSSVGRLRGGNLEFELDNYQWQPGIDGPTNIEIDKYNHLMKAAMYAFYAHLNGPVGGITGG